jgi:hypothetical protein
MLSRILSLLGRTAARVTRPSPPDPPAPPVEPVRSQARTIQPDVTLYDEGQPVRRVCVKKYGAGKSFAWISGPDEYAAAAGQCLIRSFSTISYIMEDLFRERMRERGVPDAVTDEFLRSARINDESFLTEPE